MVLAFQEKALFCSFRPPFKFYLSNNFKSIEDRSMKFCTKIAQSVFLRYAKNNNNRYVLLSVSRDGKPFFKAKS